MKKVLPTLQYVTLIANHCPLLNAWGQKFTHFRELYIDKRIEGCTFKIREEDRRGRKQELLRAKTPQCAVICGFLKPWIPGSQCTEPRKHMFSAATADIHLRLGPGWTVHDHLKHRTGIYAAYELSILLNSKNSEFGKPLCYGKYVEYRVDDL